MISSPQYSIGNDHFWQLSDNKTWPLRRDIAESLERFTSGELDANSFLDDLRDMGIEVDCTADQLTLTSR